MDILVDNASEGWRWYSVIFPSLAGVVEVFKIAVEASWIALPADLKASLDPNWITAIAVVLLIAGVIGRFIKQPKAPAVGA